METVASPLSSFPEKPKTALAATVEDAEVLADYASREAMADVDQHVRAIAEAHDLLERGELSGPAQTEFYTAYSALSERLKPVTVTSLRDSLDKYGPKANWRGKAIPQVSYAKRTAKIQRMWTFFALSLLIIFQAYLLVGQSLLSALPERPGQLADGSLAPQAISDLAAYILNFDAAQATLTNNSLASKSLAAAPTNLIASARTNTVSEDILQKMITISLFYHERGDVADMLSRWTSPVKFFTRRFTAAEDEPDSFENDWLGRFINPTDDQDIANARHIIDVLQQIILPLVYGFLGAQVYALRRIAREAAERTYREDDKIGYTLRAMLGTVAGLAIGWFLRPDKLEIDGASSMSPFALAFVAGYSVDLLFTALDRIVLAFSGTPAGAVPAAAGSSASAAPQPAAPPKS